MRKISQPFPLLLLLLLLLPAAVLARSNAPPPSATRAVKSLTEIPVASLPALPATTVQTLAATPNYGGAPLQFAVAQPLDLSTATAGAWETLSDGGQLWRLRLYAPGATDLNLAFANFALPAGATLHISSESENYYQGPYTEADNRPHGELWTPVIPGERAVVELYLPPGATLAAPLRLIQAGTGFLDLFHHDLTAKSGSCNNMTICPEGDPWRNEIRSVARYTISGAFLCTGTLIMDVPRSFKPYFLTAAHCDVTTTNDHTVVMYWNYEAPTCSPGGQSAGNLNDNQSGSTWRAGRTDVDFTLLELDSQPDPAFNVYWAGWDNSGAAASSSVAIHHPSGDAKAISFNLDPLTTMDSCIGSGSNTHWRVDDWEDGTTEPGSSGSGLWDSATHRIVGMLSGGLAACPDNNNYDCFGKFAVAWDGTSASSRLRNWLDPNNTGATGVDGSDIDPTLFNDGFEDTAP